MSSFFAGWSAYDIVGPLNKREVRGALLDFDIEKKWFRSWDSIEDMILNASDDVKNALYQSAMVKKKVEERHRMDVLKRRLDYQTMVRNVRRRLGECIFMIRKISRNCYGFSYG